ncbi:MAG: hypothetical protein M3Z20_18235 [Chloroflexota bacterium]|nr:hypothetical protein [Chloroflexota bacterium]
MRAAEVVSALELSGDMYSMYRSLHPDAQVLIPQQAVTGWYKNEFLHFGEPPFKAMKVRFTSWTWGVTGETYPETAIVAMKQTLDDGTVVWDDVRLVQDSAGNWCWFFGKDRDFVLDQTKRFVAPNVEVGQYGTWGVGLGKPCTATIDCSQNLAAARCVEGAREGVTQKLCLYGPNGYCTSDEDCHQEDGRTECIGETRQGHFSGKCLRAGGASCKASRDCMESFACLAGRCQSQ